VFKNLADEGVTPLSYYEVFQGNPVG
jgi:hypothetical protein